MVTRYDAGTTKAAMKQEDAFKTDLEVGSRVHVIDGVLISRNWVPRLTVNLHKHLALRTHSSQTSIAP